MKIGKVKQESGCVWYWRRCGTHSPCVCVSPRTAHSRRATFRPPPFCFARDLSAAVVFSVNTVNVAWCA